MDLGPLLDGRGMLPPASNPYGATLNELYETFVEQAPFRPRRELIFRALSLYAELVWQESPEARLWIDGGFATHKVWEAPEDADVVVIVPLRDYRKFIFTDSLMPLHTCSTYRHRSRAAIRRSSTRSFANRLVHRARPAGKAGALVGDMVKRQRSRQAGNSRRTEGIRGGDALMTTTADDRMGRLLRSFQH